MSDCLRTILARLKRKREIGFKIVDRKQLGVFELEPLCAICWNRCDLNGKSGGVSVFAFLFKKARINLLKRNILVELFSPPFLQNHPWNSDITVPYRKI